VACAALADAIMAGEPPAPLRYREAGSLRLGILADMVLDGLAPEVARAFERAKARLGEAGARLADVRFPELVEINAINAKGGIVGAEAWAVHRQRIAASGAQYDPRVAGRIEFSREISAADYLDYHARRNAMISLFAGRFEGFDAVMMPTTPNVPPAIAALAEDKDYFRFNALALRNTRVANFLNGCAISLPMSAPGEAPCGLSLMAPAGHDRALLAAAAAVERSLRGTGNGNVPNMFA
jgi:aspartyl-tRNA(Asn)/glutamyl-tRNA(Gln) amidotransferase subunit A